MRCRLLKTVKGLAIFCILFATIGFWRIHSAWNTTKRRTDHGYENKHIKQTSLLDNRPIALFQRERSLLHIHEWKADEFCLSTLQDVYWHPLFPKYPSKHGLVQSLDQITKGTNDAAIRRVFFWICPPFRSRYQFLIAGKGGFDMFLTEWSNTEDDENGKALYHFKCDDACLGQRVGVSSEWIELDLNKVYQIDLIHWVKSSGYVEIKWKTPMLNFAAISSELICSPSDTTIALDPKHVLPDAPFTPKRERSLKNPLYRFYEREQRTLRNFFTNLRTCNYIPSYLIKGKVEKFKTWQRAVEGKFFPYYPLLNNLRDRVLLSSSTAHDVASEVLSVIQRGGCRSCKMDRVVFVEQNKETKRGHRYFVEIDVTDTITNQTIRVSDHVYKPDNGSPICFPNGHIWSRDVDLNVVFVTSIIYKEWTMYLLDSIAKIFYTTGDRNTRLGIAAYGMKNVDLDHELTKRNLQGTVLRMSGKFNKVRALNAIVRTIRDPDSLVFTLDLHLELPFHIFDQARKNTISGKTVFAPALVALPCGKHLEYTDRGSAFWAFQGFGLLGIYKKDWDIVGGMNEELFGLKWGKEDWEMISRVISKGYEVIRRRVAGFYHIHHARQKSDWYQTRKNNLGRNLQWQKINLSR